MSLVLILTIAFLAAFTLTGLWLFAARARAWLDHPNLRSSHEIPTPLGGGVGIVAAFLALWFWQQYPAFNSQEFRAIVAVLALALVGLLDDFYRLGIRLRLLLQVMAVGSLWPFLTGLPPLMLPFALSLHGGVLAALLSVAILWLVNLYNFMDGIDALAATEAIFVSCAISVLAILAGLPMLDSKALYLGAAVAGFLFFNLPPARIFMGDVGSYFLGFTISIIGLQEISQGRLGYWSLPILLGTFVADATTTLFGRFLSGAVWYHPHCSHAYQLLVRRWQNHGLVVLLYMVVNALWLFPLAWWSERQPEYGFWITMLAWLPLATGVTWIRRVNIVPS